LGKYEKTSKTKSSMIQNFESSIDIHI